MRLRHSAQLRWSITVLLTVGPVASAIGAEPATELAEPRQYHGPAQVDTSPIDSTVGGDPQKEADERAEPEFTRNADRENRPTGEREPLWEFERRPITDGALITMSLGFAFFAEATVYTGELSAQEPKDTSKLLAIDRWVAESDEKPGAALMSHIGLGLAGAYGVIVAPALTGARLGKRDGWTTFIIYLEGIAINWAVTDIAKLGVRRPRPSVYLEMHETGTVGEDTQKALSFYSGHVAWTAGIAATATYFAFVRNANRWQKWLTLGLGTALTTFVAINRVRAREHFPTDVIAGAIAGAGVGILVPHLHRIRRDRVAVSPTTDGHSSLGLVLTARM